MKTTSVKSAAMFSASSRMDAPYYLNEAVAYYAGLEKCPYDVTNVRDESERVFFGNIFSRRFVATSDHGMPYLRASEIQKADLCDGNLYLAKEQANELSNLQLKKGWILVTCSGSLGSCVFSDARFEKLIGTHDLIRIVPRRRHLSPEALFAFLASKYGYATLTHSQYGSVILHTNPEQVQSIRVPVFPDEIQERVSELIDKAVTLRESGDAAITAALEIFNSYLKAKPLPRVMMIGGDSASGIESRNIRFDAQFVLGTKKLREEFEREKVSFRPLVDFTTSIFIGNRGKRIYTKKGIAFLTTSAALQANPMRSARTISRRNPGLESFIVHRDDILISRSGTVDTVGHVSIVGDDIAETAVSDDAIRVVIDSRRISPYYVYAYLRTKLAKSNLEHLAYGSAILHINEPLVGGLLIPILPKHAMQQVVELSRSYKEMYARAASHENEAIDMVEREIESWQEV